MFNYTKIYPILSRASAAILGGYALANIITIALAHLLPMPYPESVITSMMSSFIVYTAAVMWVFSAKSAGKAWAGLIALSFICAVLGILILPEQMLAPLIGRA